MKIPRFIKLFASFLFIYTLSISGVWANKWYVNSSIGDDTYDGTSPADLGGNVGPFQTMQWALIMAVPTDSIYVSDGYYYGNLMLDKPIFIYGNNTGIAGNGTRNTETIFLTDQQDLSRGPNPLNSVIYISSPDVYIDGIRVDGDNTGITSGNDIRGRDVDISYGVSNAGLFDNIQILNSVFENLNVTGISLRGNVNSSNSNCLLRDNLLQNFGNNSVAIECVGFYTDIITNIIAEANIGIWFNDFKTPNGRSWQVNGNSVYALTIGYIIENCFGNASSLFVENNLFSTPSGIISDFGVYMNNNRDNFKVRFVNNNLSNSGEAYNLTNNNLPPILFDRDSIENCDFGIRLNNFLNNNKTDTVMVTGCQFQTCAIGGIELFNDSNRIELIVNNTIFKNSDGGILLKGNCHVEPNDAAFDNIGTYYMLFDDAISGLRSSTDVDATKCTFNGSTGSASSDSVNFLTEDKIRHYLDENKFAFVIFKPQTIYITTNDGNFWIAPAFAKAGDNWSVFLDTVNCPEDVVIDKQLHFYTRGFVSIGSFVMDAPGKMFWMHGPIQMANTLTLKDGIFNTTDGIATVGQDQFAPPFNPVSGGSATSYVEGPLRIVAETKALDTLYFPVGKTGDFRPISMVTEATVLGAIGTLEVELNQGPPPSQNTSNGITHLSQVHHWRTNNIDGLAFSNIGFGGTYAAITNDDEVSDPSALRLAAEDNGTWVNIGGVGSGVGTGFIVSTLSNKSMSYVALANAGRGSNSLGKAGPIAAFDVTQSCFPDSVVFTDISSNSGGAITSWQWAFGDSTTTGDTSILQNPSYTFPTPGLYTIRLVVANAAAETDTAVKVINVQAPPKAGFANSVPCFPGGVFLVDTSISNAADPISSWSWSVDGTPYTTSIVNHSFGASGTHTVGLRVTSQNGCSDTITQTFFQGDTVQISISPAGPVSICASDTATLTATPGINRYMWSNGDTTNSIAVTQSGSYVVTGFNGTQCFARDTVIVTVIASPTADAGPDQDLAFGESTTLAGSGGGSYDWSPATGLSDKNISNPTAKPTKTTTYILRVFNSFGCEDFDTVVITVAAFENVDIPNLITPNNDGHNDVWDLSILPGHDSATVSVINRWGKEVFKSISYKNNWEGTYENQPLPDGSYLYIIESKETFGTLKGTLIILR